MCTMCIEVSVLRTALRGQSETRVHLQSLEQKMMSNKERGAFYHKIKNKQHLLSLLVTYLCADDFVKSSVVNTG